MTQGFIITLASNSFPGAKCFVYNMGGFGFSGGRKIWGRITELEMAYVFSTVAEAQAVVNELMAEIRYQAPEVNGHLAARLAQAEIVPA